MIPVPEGAKDKVWNSVVDFLVKETGKYGSGAIANRIEGLRSDRAFAGDVQKAIERAAARFVEEYPDKDLARALAVDTRFYDLPSVQNAVRELLTHPYAPAPRVTLETGFADVLPVAAKKKTSDAAQFFLERLREELIGVKKLHDTLDLVLQLETIKTQTEMSATLKRIEKLLEPETLSLDSARAKYLDYLIATNTYVYPRGIMQMTRSVSLKLDEVYVSLTAERAVSGLLREADKRMMARRAEEESESEEPRVERIELAQAVRENARIVVLGEPGAGKTTLVRFLALQFARALKDLKGLGNLPGLLVRDKDGNEYGQVRLPILVRIANYADAFSKNGNLSVRDFFYDAFGDVDAPREAIAQVLADVLREGNALVLLDGLDEIVDVGDRVQIARRIEGFVAGVNSRNRFVVTSRVAGYRSAPLDGDFAEITLRELEREQIEKFLKHWCVAVERFHTPDAPENEIAKRAQVEIDGILKSVDENAGVRRLAANPLMLTILALIHRAGARLPSRRVELYELATKTLLEDWELARGIPSAKIVRESEALRLLGPLAYWMHATKPSGLASEREVKQKLAEALAATRNVDPESAEVQDAVDDFLRRVREHTGIFVERAPKQYGFMHLTFEEYFAARELVRRRGDAARRIYQHRHQPRWEEPILLAIGFVSNDYPDDVTALIRTSILAEGEEAAKQDFKPGLYEDMLHRDLLFAVRCVGDCAGLDADFRQRVGGKLLKIYFDFDGEGKYEPLRERIQNTLSYPAGSEIGEEVTRLLLLKLTDSNKYVRVLAAEALVKLGQVTPDVVAALRMALHEYLDDYWNEVVEVLTKLKQTRPELVPWVEIKEEHGVKPTEAMSGEVAYWLMLLRDADSSVGLSAAVTLVNLGDVHNVRDEVVAGLLAALRDDARHVRDHAAWALGELHQVTQEVLEGLLAALHDEDSGIRWRVTEALGRLNQATPRVAAGLLAMLGDHDKYVRVSAAEVLVKLGTVTPNVSAIILAALRDEDSDLRTRAALALAALCVSSAMRDARMQILRIVESLRAALEDPRNQEGGWSNEKFYPHVIKRYTHVYNPVWEALWMATSAYEEQAREAGKQ